MAKSQYEMVALRWFSDMNPDMDCIVIVSAEDEDIAEEAIRTGVEEFWDSDDLCWGDCVVSALDERKVPHTILYMPGWGSYDLGEFPAELDDAWEAYLGSLEKNGISVKIVRT